MYVYKEMIMYFVLKLSLCQRCHGSPCCSVHSYGMPRHVTSDSHLGHDATTRRTQARAHWWLVGVHFWHVTHTNNNNNNNERESTKGELYYCKFERKEKKDCTRRNRTYGHFHETTRKKRDGMVVERTTHPPGRP